MIRRAKQLYPTRRTSRASAFYVYAYVDGKGNVFYIGKGTGKRAYSHINKERTDMWWHLQYLDTIGLGYKVNIMHCKSRKEALAIEASLINTIGIQRDGSGPLFNVIKPKIR